MRLSHWKRRFEYFKDKKVSQIKPKLHQVKTKWFARDARGDDHKTYIEFQKVVKEGANKKVPEFIFIISSSSQAPAINSTC